MQTPEQQKAQELVNKFLKYIVDNELDSVINDKRWHAANLAKECIEEIIAACEYNAVESYNTEWWKRVIKEIDANY